jgi:predicted RNA-binding Zn ribbon-like protein
VFRWLGEPLAIDLANTVMVVREGEAVDLLATAEDLRRWLDAERPRVGDCAFAVRHLDEVRALRDAVRALLIASAEGATLPARALERVNRASAAAPVAPQLAPGDDGQVEIVERASNRNRLDRLLGSLARSVMALLTGAERERLHVCRAPSCGMLYLGQRRWCCAACGNRARAARHYRRTHP